MSAAVDRERSFLDSRVSPVVLDLALRPFLLSAGSAHRVARCQLLVHDRRSSFLDVGALVVKLVHSAFLVLVEGAEGVEGKEGSEEEAKRIEAHRGKERERRGREGDDRREESPEGEGSTTEAQDQPSSGSWLSRGRR